MRRDRYSMRLCAWRELSLVQDRNVGASQGVMENGEGRKDLQLRALLENFNMQSFVVALLTQEAVVGENSPHRT